MQTNFPPYDSTQDDLFIDQTIGAQAKASAAVDQTQEAMDVFARIFSSFSVSAQFLESSTYEKLKGLLGAYSDFVDSTSNFHDPVDPTDYAIFMHELSVIEKALANPGETNSHYLEGMIADARLRLIFLESGTRSANGLVANILH